MLSSLASTQAIKHPRCLAFTKKQLECALEHASLDPTRYPPVLFQMYARVYRLTDSPAVVVKYYMNDCPPEGRTAIVELYCQLGTEFCRNPEKYKTRAQYLSELFFLLWVECTPKTIKEIISLVKDKKRFNALPNDLQYSILGILKREPLVETKLWRRVFKRNHRSCAMTLLNILAQKDTRLGLKALDHVQVVDEKSADLLFAMLLYPEKGVVRPSNWTALVRERLSRYPEEKRNAIADWLAALEAKDD